MVFPDVGDSESNPRVQKVSLNVLVDLAEVLLEVEELEIYVDSSSALLKPLPDNPPQFGKLKKLSFGTSPLRKEDWFEIQVYY